MRVKRGTVRHDNRKRILQRAEGYYGSRHKLFKTAKEAVLKAEAHAFNGRKERKQDYRKLWIRRISAACKLNDISYSQFMHGLDLAEIKLNRKIEKISLFFIIHHFFWLIIWLSAEFFIILQPQRYK